MAPDNVGEPLATLMVPPPAMMMAEVSVTRFEPLKDRVPVQLLKVGNVTDPVLVSTVVVVAPDGPTDTQTATQQRRRTPKSG